MCTHFTNNILFINIINTIYTVHHLVPSDIFYNQFSFSACFAADNRLKYEKQMVFVCVRMFCIYLSVWPFRSVQMALMAVFFFYVLNTFKLTSRLMFPTALVTSYVTHCTQRWCFLCALLFYPAKTRPYQLLQLATANMNHGMLIA